MMLRFPAKKICFIRTSAIGDVVNALVLVNGLRRGYPNAEITWITQDIPGQVLSEQPSINKLITYNRNMSFTHWISFLKKLRRERYDLLVVPQVSVKASIIATAVRAPIKIGFDFKRARELSWLVTNRRIPAGKPGHVVDQYMEFAHYIGIDYPEPIWGLRFSHIELAWRDQWASQFSKPIVAFVPASSSAIKDWPVNHHIDVMNQIGDSLDVDMVIIGGPGQRERQLAEKIVSKCRHFITLALEKPVRNTLLQLSCSRVVIAPDTGPLHMAVAMNIPTIGLYGYSNPNRCGPYHFRELLIDKFNPDTLNPLPITRKTKPGQMKNISPDDVFQKIQLALNRPYQPGYPLK